MSVEFTQSGNDIVVREDEEEFDDEIVESPIGYYVSREDADKFDRLLSDPFGRD